MKAQCKKMEAKGDVVGKEEGGDAMWEGDKEAQAV